MWFRKIGRTVGICFMAAMPDMLSKKCSICICFLNQITCYAIAELVVVSFVIVIELADISGLLWMDTKALQQVCDLLRE